MEHDIQDPVVNGGGPPIASA